MVPLLEAFLDAEVTGVDFDPAMVLLARARLSEFGERAAVILADLRQPTWMEFVSAPIDAAVSATALHWFTRDQVATLYRQLAEIIRPGGIFLNADHVGSDSGAVQAAWERHREEMRREVDHANSDDWDGFWEAYSEALGLSRQEIRERVVGGCGKSIEEGFPLAWHFDELRRSGFSSVDCFWRCDCDSIYGGIAATKGRKKDRNP